MSRTEASLTLFAHVCGKPEEELELAVAALLLGELRYPEVDVRHYLDRLDQLGGEVRAELDGAALVDPREKLERLLEVLYGRLGFHGNRAEYYDPCNSFLGDVIDRKSGIPISLALVLTEIARRAGIETEGVSFPGHFLVRASVPGGLLIVDPFEGRLLRTGELRSLYGRSTGASGNPPPASLAPASKRQILFRMLANLRAIYTERSDREELRGVLERMQILEPSADSGHELASLGGARIGRTTNRAVN